MLTNVHLPCARKAMAAERMAIKEHAVSLSRNCKVTQILMEDSEARSFSVRSIDLIVCIVMMRSSPQDSRHDPITRCHPTKVIKVASGQECPHDLIRMALFCSGGYAKGARSLL